MYIVVIQDKLRYKKVHKVNIIARRDQPKCHLPHSCFTFLHRFSLDVFSTLFVTHSRGLMSFLVSGCPVPPISDVAYKGQFPSH